MKIGDYIRTYDGFIAKLIDIEENLYTFDNTVFLSNDEYQSKIIDLYEDELKSAKKKTSRYLIDLIELGDYVLVQGEDTFLQVKYIDTCEGCMRELYFTEDGMDMGYWNEQIKAVIPKEQINSITYKVNDFRFK